MTKREIIDREINQRIEIHKDDKQLVKILELIGEIYITIFCQDPTQEVEPFE